MGGLLGIILITRWEINLATIESLGFMSITWSVVCLLLQVNVSSEISYLGDLKRAVVHHHLALGLVLILVSGIKSRVVIQLAIC